MTKKLFLSQAEKVKTGFWSLSQDKAARLFFYLLILFLPTQLGKHFWPQFSFVFGLRLDYLSPTIYLTDVFIVFIFLFSLKKISSELKKISKKNLLLYLVFLLSLFVGLIDSLNPLAGLYGILKIIEFSFLGFYVFASFKDIDKKIIFALLSTSIFFESLLSIFQYLNNSSIGGLFYFFGERAYNAQTPGIANATINGQLFLRPYGTFSHPNVLAGFLIISVLFLLMLNLKVKKTKLVLLTIFISFISLMLSLSRSAIILSFSYVFYSFTFLISEKFKNGKSKTGFVLIALSSATLFLLLILFKDSEVLQRFLSINLTDESVLQRKELIIQSINMISSSPIFGVGINNFYNNLKLVNQAHVVLVQPVHNLFFLIFAETGFIGLSFFSLIFYKVFRLILRLRGIERICLSLIFISILFLGFFDHYFLTIQQGQLLLTLFLGTAFSYKKT